MLEMHCVMASVRCGHVEAGRVNFCTVRGKNSDGEFDCTYPARTYFLPVREKETMAHTKKKCLKEFLSQPSCT